MELTNLSYIKANDRLNSSHKDKNLAISRLSTGNRLNKPGLDAGAFSIYEVKFQQKVLNGKMLESKNPSYLKAQKAINSAMKT